METAKELRDGSVKRGIRALEGVIGADPEVGMDGANKGESFLSQFQMRGTSLSQLSGSFPVLDSGRPQSRTNQDV